MAKGTDVTLFDAANSPAPAHLTKIFGETSNNELGGGVHSGYPVISFKGKSWSLRENGTSTLIMRPDDPDEVTSTLEVVIVKANPNLSKVYYAGGYTEGSDEKPVCYSHDGVRPASDAQAPQCGTCAACPHNAWGSRISENGAKGKACSDSRRVAVVPSGELGRPMLLRIPAATLKDLSAYGSLLTSRNAPYQAVLTKIGFDHTVAHPKLTFRAIRWLTAAEAQQVADTLKSEIVEQIVGTAQQAKAVDALAHLPAKPAHVEAAAPAPAVAPAPKPRAKKAEALPAPEAPKGKPLAAAPAAAKAAPEPSKASAQVIESNDELDAALAALDDI